MNLSLKEIYKIHSDILQRHKDRFVVFAGIDPRRGADGYSIFKDSIEHFDFKGLKLYPSFGFSMSHRELNQYYELCETRNLPILFHTGPSIDRLDKTIADPKNIVSIAKDYPACNFILAHAGFKLNEKEIQKLAEIKNVYFDISGFQSVAPDKRKDALKLIFNKRFVDKVLFGSDWPLFHVFSAIKKDIAFIKDIFENAPSPTDNDEFALDKIFYKNAAKLLSL